MKTTSWIARWALLPVSLLIAVGFFLLNSSSGVEVERFQLREFSTAGSVPPGGQAFFAEIVLESPGYPLLVCLDEAGWPNRLFPYGGWVGLPAGEALRLPDPDRGVTWTSSEPLVPDRFLLAVTRDRGIDLDAVLREAQDEALRAPNRQEARHRVVEVLEQHLGPVRTARRGPDRT